MENTEKFDVFNALDPSDQEHVGLGHLATLHLNSAIYRINLDEKQETHHVYYQRNNPIPVVGCIIERRVQTTYNALNKEMEEKFKDTKEKYEGWCCWPFIKNSFRDDFDTVSDFTIAYGWRVVERKKDPNEPVAVPVDDPEMAVKLRDQALMPYYVTVPFMIAYPETKDYFFTVSLDHIPMTAIRYYDTTKNERPEDPNETMEEGMMPLGIDTSKPYMSKEDRERYNAIRLKIEEKLHAGSLIGMKMEDVAQNIDFNALAEEFGFESGETLKGFMNFAGSLLSMPQE